MSWYDLWHSNQLLHTFPSSFGDHAHFLISDREASNSYRLKSDSARQKLAITVGDVEVLVRIDLVCRGLRGIVQRAKCTLGLGLRI
jgi:hypothetical protein